ncbi:hypothetical protein L195_g004410, partial [Trifolium pratense]
MEPSADEGVSMHKHDYDAGVDKGDSF